LKTGFLKTIFTLTIVSGLLFSGFYIIRHRQIYQEHCRGSTRFDIGLFSQIHSGLITESSGLLRHSDSLFYTHNDDTDSCLYLISAAGNLKGRVCIPFHNRDWEDISSDGRGRLFIGDIGNNFYRQDTLKVLIFNEKEKNSEGIIRMSFLDEKGENSAFDFEAMVWQADSLYLFSKDKRERNSLVFAVPDRPGDYTLSPKQKIPVAGMVTSAALRPDGKEFALLTYGKIYFYSLSFGLSQIPAPDFCLAYWPMRQSESLCYLGRDSLLLGNEQGNLYLLKRK